MMKNETSNGGYSLTGLVELYQTTKGDGYFEALWNEVKAFAITKIKRYPSIEREEAISIAMECLWEAACKIKKGKNILTFYGRILDNRLYDTFFKKMQSNKYKLNSEAASLEQLKEDLNYEPSMIGLPFSLEMFNSECHFIEKEIVLVQMISAGYKQKEIIKQLQMDIESYTNLLNNVKEKIQTNYIGRTARI